VRGLNDYGNMFMLRESSHWIHWLFEGEESVWQNGGVLNAAVRVRI